MEGIGALLRTGKELQENFLSTYLTLSGLYYFSLRIAILHFLTTFTAGILDHR